MKIKACIFDAFGTLFNLDQSLLADISYADLSDILEYTRSKQLTYTWLHSLMVQYRPFDEITRIALSDGCKKYGAPQSLVSELSKLYFAPVVFSDVLPGLKQIRQKPELVVGILSNGTEKMLQAGINLNQMKDYLDRVYSVEQVEVFKPDPRVYQIVVDDLQCIPEQVIFVSSNQWDVAGALSFGFQACWLNRRHAFKESIIQDDHVLEINSLTEVVDCMTD